MPPKAKKGVSLKTILSGKPKKGNKKVKQPIASNKSTENTSDSDNSDSESSSSDESVFTETIATTNEPINKHLKKRKLEIEAAVAAAITSNKSTTNNVAQKKQKRIASEKKPSVASAAVGVSVDKNIPLADTGSSPSSIPVAWSRGDNSDTSSSIKKQPHFIPSPSSSPTPIDWTSIYETYAKKCATLVRLNSLTDINGADSVRQSSQVYQNVVWINLYMGNLCEFIAKYQGEIQALCSIINGDGSQSANGAPDAVNEALLEQAYLDLGLIQKSVQSSTADKTNNNNVDYSWFYHMCEFERKWPQLQANDNRKNAIESLTRACAVVDMFVKQICILIGPNWHASKWFDHLSEYLTSSKPKIGDRTRVVTVSEPSIAKLGSLLAPFESLDDQLKPNRVEMYIWYNIARNVETDRNEPQDEEDLADVEYQQERHADNDRKNLHAIELFIKTRTDAVVTGMVEAWQEAELWHSLLSQSVPLMKNMTHVLYISNKITDNSALIAIRDRYNTVKSEINQMMTAYIETTQTYLAWCRALVLDRFKAERIQITVTDIAKFLSGNNEPVAALTSQAKMLLDVNNVHASMMKECEKIIDVQSHSIKFLTKNPNQDAPFAFNPSTNLQKEQIDKCILGWLIQRTSSPSSITSGGGTDFKKVTRGDTEQHMINWFADMIYQTLVVLTDTAAADLTSAKSQFITNFTSFSSRSYDTKIYRMFVQTILPIHPLVATLEKIETNLLKLTPVYNVKYQTSSTDAGKSRIDFLANHGRRSHVLAQPADNVSNASDKRDLDVEELKRRFFFAGESSCEDIVFNSNNNTSQRSLSFGFPYSYEHLIHFLHASSAFGDDAGRIMMIEFRDTHFLVYYNYGMNTHAAIASWFVDSNGEVKLLDLNYYLKTRNVKSIVNSKRILTAYLSASFFPIATWSASRQPFLFVKSYPNTSGDLSLDSANQYVLQLGFNINQYTGNYERRYHSYFVQHMMKRLFFYTFEQNMNQSSSSSSALANDNVTAFDIFEPLKDLGIVLQELYNEFSKPSNAHSIPQQLLARLSAINDMALIKCYVMSDINNTITHKRNTNKFVFKFSDGENYEVARLYQHDDDLMSSVMKIVTEQRSNHLKMFVQAAMTSDSNNRILLIRLFAIQPPVVQISNTEPTLSVATTSSTVDNSMLDHQS